MAKVEIVRFECDKCAGPASITCRYKAIDTVAGKNAEESADFCSECWPLGKKNKLPAKREEGPQDEETPKQQRAAPEPPIEAHMLPNKKLKKEKKTLVEVSTELERDAEEINIEEFKLDKKKIFARLDKAVKKSRLKPDINDKIIERAVNGVSVEGCSHKNKTITSRELNSSICNDCGQNLIGGRKI